MNKDSEIRNNEEYSDIHDSITEDPVKYDGEQTWRSWKTRQVVPAMLLSMVAVLLVNISNIYVLASLYE